MKIVVSRANSREINLHFCGTLQKKARDQCTKKTGVERLMAKIQMPQIGFG